ncbi:MAG TPA: TetR/AcrR family transcriptional regulator [Gemmatimonadales bacterium]|nr:TetR/AcrR family transcriptional regulator [Gemmatimonadales bacterium]
MDGFDRRLQQLLASAAKVFAERGYHGASMRDVARASGMSLAGIYHYVRGKQELLFLIQDRCFAAVIAGARGAVGAEATPVDRIRAFIRHHILFFAAHMDEMKVLAHEEEELSGTMRAQVRARKREYVNLLLGLLDGVPGPRVSRRVAAYALFGMMNWIYTWYHPTGAIPAAQLAEEIAALFLGGYAEPALPATSRLVASHGG